MLTQLACLNNDLYPCIISMLYMLQDYTHDRRMIVSYCGNSKTRRHKKVGQAVWSFARAVKKANHTFSKPPYIHSPQSWRSSVVVASI